MKKIVSKLALAAALAAAVPAAARAEPCDDHDRRAPAPAVYVPAQTVYTPAGQWRGHDRPRHDGWRAQEQARLRIEFARLDEARDRFYAVHHRRGEVRRFERWYGERRAELERRWSEVSYYAWR